MIKIIICLQERIDIVIMLLLTDLNLPEISLPQLISSSDVDSLTKSYKSMTSSQNEIRSDISTIKGDLSSMKYFVIFLVIAVVVLAAVLTITIIVHLCKYNRSKSSKTSKVKASEYFAELIERKAYTRVEELFSDVKFEAISNVIKLNKGFAELFYVGFQFAICNLDSSQLKVEAVNKICERNNIFCDGIIKINTSVYMELNSIIKSVKEAIKSESPFALQSCLRTRLSNNMYDELVEQKNVLQEMMKWLDDSKAFIDLQAKGY